jgi:hypothetical protein
MSEAIQSVMGKKDDQRCLGQSTHRLFFVTLFACVIPRWMTSPRRNSDSFAQSASPFFLDAINAASYKYKWASMGRLA